ncbi:hypothetical protein B0H66DRAFT_57112 [Apodospora peruviana]|uniref:Uncharacterized protein n=1 Tax=Apodospora peruviana TaxID=516989 RepID=A0AAE0IS61_9PEZI|nr:hypothetical protein B0H66DRAFT_57112 [Apodospora peruviana]
MNRRTAKIHRDGSAPSAASAQQNSCSFRTRLLDNSDMADLGSSYDLVAPGLRSQYMLPAADELLLPVDDEIWETRDRQSEFRDSYPDFIFSTVEDFSDTEMVEPVDKCEEFGTGRQDSATTTATTTSQTTGILSRPILTSDSMDLVRSGDSHFSILCSNKSSPSSGRRGRRCGRWNAPAGAFFETHSAQVICRPSVSPPLLV